MAAAGSPAATGRLATGPDAADPVATDPVAGDPLPTSSQVVAIGSGADVAGLALAGVRVVPAATAVAALEAWDELSSAQVAVVLLTAQAAAGLGEARWSPGSPMSVVLPVGGPSDPVADEPPRADEEGAGG